MEDFPQYCWNGVIFFDLINKVSGKEAVLKGVVWNPKNVTHVLANYQKVMSHLKQFEKMNSWYLFSEDQMMNGDSDTIWGFLDDIWHLKNNKFSKHDTAAPQKPCRATSCMNWTQTTLNQTPIRCQDGKWNSIVESIGDNLSEFM